MDNSIPVVIFGAGASHDAESPNAPSSLFEWQPPLTNELFLLKSERANYLLASKYKSAHGVLNEIREELIDKGRGLEDILLEIKQQNNHYEGLVSIQYFLADFFSTASRTFLSNAISNYDLFVDKLANKLGGFVYLHLIMIFLWKVLLKINLE